MTAATAESAAVAQAGRSELGTITIADGVVSKIAARAAAENPDAGAAAARVLGRAVPGAGHLGLRGTDLAGLPKASVDVDGSKAFLTWRSACAGRHRCRRLPIRFAATSAAG
jgi:hypothetical protein